MDPYVIVSVVVALAAAALAVWRSVAGSQAGRSWADDARKREVVVHTTTDTSIRGWLIGDYPDALVLGDARMLVSGQERPLDGRTLIPRNRVAFVQELAAEAPRRATTEEAAQ